METAYFAGGCFWCITPTFQEMEGVSKVTSGYAGGNEENPVYADVKYQRTGHRETIRIDFDPQIVAFEALLDIFLSSVDPHDPGGQFIDRGHSYTLAIYYLSDAQKEAAQAAVSHLAETSGQPVYISIEPYKNFYCAEEEHQDYYLKHPAEFRQELIDSGRIQAVTKEKFIMDGFVNYAHRGASEYLPENTLLAFYTGIYMGANGIETDVQRTKDGILVLFHDDTLKRVTGQAGSVGDYTFAQLQEFDVQKNGFTDKIVAFEDFLQHFSHRDITFAIELKGTGVEKDTADLLRKYNMLRKTVVTSFQLEYLRTFRAYAPEFQIGYLTESVAEETFEVLKSMGAEEYCPEAHLMTPDLVEKWHRMGFRVRAWGVYNEELMRHAYICGADGMTVNFPDKLTQYLK